MSWGRNNSETISATGVIKLLVGERGHDWDPKKAQDGIQMHTKILNAITEQITPNMFGVEARKTALPIEEGQVMSRGRELSLKVSSDLQMKLIPDMILRTGKDLACVEIKKNFRETDLLQLMYGCMAADAHFSGNLTQGALYLYGDYDHVGILREGGRSFWEQGNQIAQLAADLRESQVKSKVERRTDKMVRMITDMPVTNLSEQAILIRREMDDVWGVVSAGLNGLLSL